MPFMLAFGIVAVAVMVITYRTYVGYGQYGIWIKLAFLLFLILSMSAPFLGYYLHNTHALSFLAKHTMPFYFLFGFVFILFVITFIRDILWTVADVIRRKSIDDMKDKSRLKKVNLVTILFTLLVSFYGLYEANKMPNIVTQEITSNKITQKVRMVMLSDLHIGLDTKPQTVAKIVDAVNALKPDVVVLVGDIIDATPFYLDPQLQELGKLKAPKGVYFSLGNHEFYNGALDCGMSLGKLGFNFLSNYGMQVAGTDLYIAGIPDINSAEMIKMPIKVNDALFSKGANNYTILLSHTPKVAPGVTKDNVDLQLSAHTHGGQVFPFHFLVKQANEGRLAGYYNVNGVNMYISRGTRFWGVPMRLLAPAEITIFDFKPEMNHDTFA